MPSKRCLLSVNVNKIATLRNSRGGNTPDVCQCAADLIAFGAQGITVHPRPDGRHIRYADVLALSRLMQLQRTKSKKVECNIEGYPSPEFIKLIKKVRPDQVTLVPDPPNAITSNAGWRVHQNENLLKRKIKQIHRTGARVSVFIDVFNWTKNDLAALRRIGADRVELYTERYALDFSSRKRASTTSRYADVAREIHQAGFGINAGHDLNLKNLRYLLQSIPEIEECSIGHALISESLYLGFRKTVKSYLKEIRMAQKARPSK